MLNVKLGPIKKEYLPTYVKFFNDPEITQYLLMYRPMNLEQEEEWYKAAIKKENVIYFAILIDDPEKMIGSCSINIDWRNRVGNVGITIGEKKYWGKGLGTEAMIKLCEYGFNTLNLQRIELETYEFNERAFKSYIKVGFIEEGRRRKAIFANGKYWDSITMSLLADEWNKKKK
jgi:RimJ/RimL family protein N-acetyltransferase